jgi:TnpA family transposase
MPIGFLTAADHVRLNRFPEQIPHEDLSAFFLLSKADHRVINQQHSEAHTRLGFALQLCALRYLGFAPDDLMTAPTGVVEYVAQQLGVAPHALTAYGTRRPTRTTPTRACAPALPLSHPAGYVCLTNLVRRAGLRA